MATLGIQVSGTAVHRRAQSACCGGNLQPPAAGAGHDFECSSCGQPCERVLGEPVEVKVNG